MNANQRMLKGGKSPDAARNEKQIAEWELIPKVRKKISELVVGDVIFNGSKCGDEHHVGRWVEIVNIRVSDHGDGVILTMKGENPDGPFESQGWAMMYQSADVKI